MRGRPTGCPGPYNPPECLRAYADFIEKLKTGESPSAPEQVKEIPQHMLAAKFGPTQLKRVRDAMIPKDWTRKYVNRSVGRIKRLYNWAAENEYVPADVAGAIAMVQGLEQYRSGAREVPDAEAVNDRMIEATVEQLSPEAAGMVRVARLCGYRPGELINMNAGEINRRDPECWWYRPKRHKNAHRGHSRSIPINPDAQAILAPHIASAAGGKRFHFKHRDGLRQAFQRAASRAFPHPELSKIP